MSIFFRKTILQTDESRSIQINRLNSFGMIFCFPISVYFDHLKILFTLFETFNNFSVVIMFVIFLKLLEHFMEDRIAHLMSSFLCFFEHIFVFLFKFLVLSSTAIEINFLFIAQMSVSFFFFGLFLNSRGCV